jgi:uncharacterized protein YecE (DUF72 family)
MELRVGTSGYSYKEWKGIFYPAKLPANQMLRYYGERLGTVEINQTFYRLPAREALAAWLEQVPPSFRFSVKASRRITHFKRLRDAADETAYFVDTVRVLGDRLGILLFQLPPDFKADRERLAGFLDALPRDVPSAFEFRHDSWNEPGIADLLAERGVSQVISDAADPVPALQARTFTGYLRLRREDYAEGTLADWAARIGAQPWRSVFVFFKHEKEGPARALELARAWGQQGSGRP